LAPGGARHLDHPGEQRPLASLLRHAGGVRAVQLDDVGIERAQQADVGNPGAEIVKAERHAEGAQGGGGQCRLPHVLDLGGLGHLDRDEAGLAGGAGLEQAGEAVTELGALHRLAGKVERHRRAGTVGRVAGELGHRHVELVGQPERLDQHDEILRRRGRVVRRAFRADQRLEVVGGAAGKRDDGLELQTELVDADGVPEPCRLRPGAAHVLGQAVVEPGAAQALHAIAGKHVQRLPQRPRRLGRRQLAGGEADMARGDGDLDALVAECRLQQGGDRQQIRLAPAGAEQAEPPRRDLAGQGVRRQRFERLPDRLAARDDDAAFADNLQQAEVAGDPGAQLGFGGARHVVRRAGVPHAGQRRRWPGKAQAQAQRTAGRRDRHAGQRQVGALGVGQPDHHRQQPAALHQQAERRTQRRMVGGRHEVPDRTAHERLGRAAELAAEGSGGIGHDAAGIGLHHHVGTGEGERHEAVVVVGAAGLWVGVRRLMAGTRHDCLQLVPPLATVS